MNIDNFPTWLIAAIISFVALALLNRYLRTFWITRRFTFQLVMLCTTLVATLIVIIFLPLSDTLKTQLLTLFGILLSAAVAFSSTTFISNILAGLMLRVIKSVQLGDYITVNQITGRLTEMNLLHVEIQTEESDLVTIPNLHMTTHPVKAVRSSGTIISVDISLGYDIPRQKIAKQLLLAASDTELSDSFVQTKELGDFSVTYRIAGHLDDIATLISARSRLRDAVLDRLHADNIEIVSPNFMNTRSPTDKPVIPPSYAATQESNNTGNLEKIAFEKADAVSDAAKTRSTIEVLKSQLNANNRELSEDERQAIESQLEQLKLKLQHDERRAEKDNKNNDTNQKSSL